MRLFSRVKLVELDTSSLSKRAIGDYLGEGHALNIKVMHYFVDMLDFRGRGFVPALRSFLQCFRLPGEAQKIDRLMEKFADRYTENNPSIFAKSADIAYTMAYSVIMLNTDMYSTQVKNKMDKAAFIRNNRPIITSMENDKIEKFLEDIYDDIASREIVLEEEQLVFLNNNLPKSKPKLTQGKRKNNRRWFSFK